MRRSDKKGQIIGQAFVMMIAGILLVMILFFGYKWLRSLTDEKCRVEMVDSISSLKAEVDGIRLSYGSTKKTVIKGICSRHKEICFVSGTKNSVKGLESGHALIYELYQEGGDNVFFVPQSEIPVRLDKIQVSDRRDGTGNSYFCRPIDQGVITLYLEGKGSTVLIAPW